MLRSSCCLALAMTPALLIHPATAENPGAGEVREMFADGWKVGDRALAESREHFEAASKAAPADPRIEYGWALVLIKHRKHPEAISLLNEIIRDDPQARHSRMWIIRVKMLKRDYAAALVDLEALAGTISAEPQEGNDEQDVLETIRFLGRMFGILAGPARVAANLRDAEEAAIVARFSPQRKQAFEQGRREVLDQYAKFQTEAEDLVADAKEKEELEREKQRLQIDEQRQQIAQDAESIEENQSLVRAEQRQQLAENTRDLRRVESELASAESVYGSIIRDIEFFRVEIARLLASRDAEPDPDRRRLIDLEIDRLELNLIRLQANASSQERTILRIRARGAELERQRLFIQQRFEGAMLQLDDQQKSLRKEDEQSRKKLQKISGPSKGDSPRARSIKSKATAFSTYEPFPLDEERRRVEKSFR